MNDDESRGSGITLSRHGERQSVSTATRTIDHVFEKDHFKQSRVAGHVTADLHLPGRA